MRLTCEGSFERAGAGAREAERQRGRETERQRDRETERQNAPATARQQLQSAVPAGLPENCTTILQEQARQEEESITKARPPGHKMDQVRARFKRAVEAGEKALKNVGKAQKIFAAAQEEVILAQTDLENLTKESPMPV